MARWDEERERWLGRGNPYGQDERRWREDREGGSRERGMRDEGRFPEWRGSERMWERGERGWPSSERWSRERDPREWGGREWERDTGRQEYGMGRESGEWREGRPSERWSEGREREERPWGGERWPGERWGSGRGEWTGGRGEWTGRGRGGEWGMGRWEGRGERVPYGTTTYGPGGEREWGPRGSQYGREYQPGPMEKLKEGWRKLTGKGPKGYHRSDDRIRDDVCERIAQTGMDAGEVEVKVEQGEVTLTGHVASRDDKRYLEDVADEVFGVDEVHNHLRLRREGTEAATAAATTGTETTASHAGAARTGAGQQPTGRH